MSSRYPPSSTRGWLPTRSSSQLWQELLGKELLGPPQPSLSPHTPNTCLGLGIGGWTMS
jgi:hypothetical protein